MGSLLYLSRLYKTRCGIRSDDTIGKHVVPRKASYGEAEKSVAIPRGITKLWIASLQGTCRTDEGDALTGYVDADHARDPDGNNITTV